MTQKDYYDFREDENTRQVSLVKLLRCAFKRWKLILLAGIILGGLFGAYKIMSIHSKKDAMIKAYDAYKANLEVYNTTLSDSNKVIAELQEDIAQRLQFAEVSPLMQIDPYNCGVSTAQLRIVPKGDSVISATNMYSLMYAIYDEVYYGDILKTVAERQQTEVSYLNQVVTVTVYTAGDTITLVAHGKDEALAESIREDLLDVLLSKKDKFASFGDFDFEVFDKGTSTMMDTNIQTYQQVQNDVLTKLQTALRTAQNQVTSLVKPTAVPQYSKKYMLKSGIKLGIVGFAGGACLAVIALIVLILGKGVIITADEIDGEFGLRTLADFSDGKQDDASKLAYMCARIEKCMAGKESRKVGVVGSVSGQKLDDLAAKLNEMAGDLTFVSVPDFTKDALSYKKLNEMDGVILTEEIGISDYMGIRKEIALLAENNNDLIGTVYY